MRSHPIRPSRYDDVGLLLHEVQAVGIAHAQSVGDMSAVGEGIRLYPLELLDLVIGREPALEGDDDVVGSVRLPHSPGRHPSEVEVGTQELTNAIVALAATAGPVVMRSVWWVGPCSTSGAFRGRSSPLGSHAHGRWTSPRDRPATRHRWAAEGPGGTWRTLVPWVDGS
jgi:hypothetical protein